MKAGKPSFVLVVFLLAAGMVSGAYMDNYGSLTGMINVDGPTFYSAKDNLLLENHKPNSSQEGVDYIYNSTVKYSTEGSMDKEWYPAEATMNLKAYLYNSSSPVSDIYLDFQYVNSTGTYSLCDSKQTVTIDSTSEKNYSATCQGNITGSVERFEYVIQGSENTEAYIAVDGVTGVEVKG